MKTNLLKALIAIPLMFYWTVANCQEHNNLIKSGEIWPDTEGKHINAHGGSILFHNDTYYWFGEYRLPRSEKERSRYGVSCYSSKDLLNWKNEGLALRVINDTASLLLPGCVIERPKVIYNKKTGKFVMWFHHELKGQGYKAALTGVAVSDNITGPYKYLRSLRPNAGIWPLNMTEEQKKVTVIESDLKRNSDEWKTIGNPCRGTDDDNKITFGSQSTHILPVHGKKNVFIYMGDRWTPENLADSRHIWLPVEWEKANPVIKWYPQWDLNKLK